MDRPIVYGGQQLPAQQLLNGWQSAMIGIGHLARALMRVQGTTNFASVAAGLEVNPSAPPSLNVVVNPGSIYYEEPIDASGYGLTGNVNDNPCIKQGISQGTVTLAVTPPSTAGYSQIYLIEASYETLDQGNALIAYVNTTNPNVPFQGPGGDGLTQPTVRLGACNLTLKPGVGAPSGAEVAPPLDAGYVGIAYVTVSNGQTQIVSANIQQYPDTNFVTITLPQVPGAIQAQGGNFAVDTGAAANILNVTFPLGTALTAGMPIRILKGNVANTGAMQMIATIGVGGSTLAAIPVVWDDAAAFVGGDWPANAMAEGIFDGTSVRMNGPIGPSIFARLSALPPNLSSQVATLTSEYATLLANYNTLLAEYNTLASEYTALNAALTALEAIVTALEATVAALGSTSADPNITGGVGAMIFGDALYAFDEPFSAMLLGVGSAAAGTFSDAGEFGPAAPLHAYTWNGPAGASMAVNVDARWPTSPPPGSWVVVSGTSTTSGWIGCLIVRIA